MCFLVSSYACQSFRGKSNVKSGSWSRRCLQWSSVISITIISLVSKFFKFENLHSLLSFFSSVTKLSKHCPSDYLCKKKNCIGGKSHFFEQSNNHQIVVKYNWNLFSSSNHQMQTYILPFLLVQCRLIVCWSWICLISWSFLW